MKKLLSLAAALALTAAVLSCSMVVVRASDHYGWQEGEPTPVGGFPATPTPVPVTTSFIEPNYYPDYDAEESYVVICRRLNVRPDASTRNARVDVLPRGTTVQVLSIENGWAKIVRADGSEAYVFAKHIRKV